MPATAYELQAPLGVPEAESRSLADILAIVRRRAGLLASVVLTLGVVAVAVALLLPAVYRSTATILIKEQEIPQELVRSTITSYADERIQVISQQVMTRATLLDLVDRYGLYPGERKRETSEEILDRMRRDIKLTPISAEVTDRRTGSQIKATIAFSLSYDSQVPASAQKIANELTTLFLNENLKNRQQKAAETTSFLDEELNRISAHISELEQKVAELKRRNEGRTPDLSLSNLIGAERADAEMQRIDRDILLLQERRRSLETQLAETRPQAPLAAGAGVLEPDDRLRALQTQLSGLTGVYSDSHPDIRRLRREIAALQGATGAAPVDSDRQQTLDTLRAQLGALRQRYSDDHPDVLRLRRTYDALAQAVGAGAEPAGTLKPRAPDNPVWISLRAQIEAITAQLDALRAERREQATRRDLLATRLAQTPEVEREILELLRDLDSSRIRFRELRDKQMQAQVAEQLERSRKAERFTIIEPPVFPERPQRPNRPMILLMGVVLALFGGFVAVALREALDTTVHGPRELGRVLQVPVLALLPAVPRPGASRRRRRQLALAVAVLLTALVLGAALLHWLYIPLDVGWYALLRKLGV